MAKKLFFDDSNDRGYMIFRNYQRMLLEEMAKNGGDAKAAAKTVDFQAAVKAGEEEYYAKYGNDFVRCGSVHAAR